MPNITPNPVTVTPPKTSGGSLKNPANLIAYSAAAQGPQAELWANVHKALRDAQSQLDGIANSLRAPLGIPDPIQVVDAQGNLVANIGTYVNPTTNTSFSGIWSQAIISGGDANPITWGAVGDNVTDDTIPVQQALNATGVLFLPPGKSFIVTSSILLPASPSSGLIYIYGGGAISGTANPLISSGAVNLAKNTSIVGINITSTSTTAGATLISLQNQLPGQAYNRIEGCFFGTPNAATSVAISLNANQVTSWKILDCTFQSNIGTAVALTNQTDVLITGCEFRNATGTPVSTSGTCTYNLRGCNVLDYYDVPQIPRVLAYLAAGGQVLVSATPAALTFDTNLYSLGAAIHSTVTNPTRFTAPVAGFYHAFGQFQINSITNCTLQIILKKNGAFLTPNIQTTVFQNTAAFDTALQLYGDLQLAAGDFIEFFVNQTTGANQTTSANCLGALALISQP